MGPKKGKKPVVNRPMSARKNLKVRRKKGQKEEEKPCWPEFQEHIRSEYIVEGIIDKSLL